MTKDEALEQLCKMLGVVAKSLDTESSCICKKLGWNNALVNIPDQVIEEMWKRITDLPPRVERALVTAELADFDAGGALDDVILILKEK